MCVPSEGVSVWIELYIPVRLFAATENKGLKFRFLHEPCLTPIKYQKHCPTCEREVSQEEIVRGYEYEGTIVIIREEDSERIPVKTTKSIDILDFVSITEIDPVYYDRTYYLEPADGARPMPFAPGHGRAGRWQWPRL